MIILWAALLIMAAEMLLILAIQQLMKQMRADVDAQRDKKLAKYQFAWTLWPEHRRFFPQSRLRKCHFCLMLALGAVLLSYLILMSKAFVR